MKISRRGSAVLADLAVAVGESHKGQNGRLLVIGGSKLFHSSIFWSANVASRIVDLVHFSSPANENNELVRKKLKENFWEGIVVDWGSIDEYVEEDDCVLIGPGMPRDEGLMEGERPTGEIVNELLDKHPDKHWVIDGGALQEVDVAKLNEMIIITPHQGEMVRVLQKMENGERLRSRFEGLVGVINSQIDGDLERVEELAELMAIISDELGGVTILLKGVVDLVVGRDGDKLVAELVEGGNEGMTKGGTGDVLAGVVAGLYTKNKALVSAVGASYAVNQAGDRLYARVGRYFNSSDLVSEVARVMGEFGAKRR